MCSMASINFMFRFHILTLQVNCHSLEKHHLYFCQCYSRRMIRKLNFDGDKAVMTYSTQNI